jgi:predicted RecA/RadA family phage recombinase
MAIEIERADKWIEVVTAGAVTVGTAALHQNMWGVYGATGAATGAVVPFCVAGRFKGVTKATGTAWVAGAKLYIHDNTAKTFKTTATSAETIEQHVIAGEAADATPVVGTVEIGF